MQRHRTREDKSEYYSGNISRFPKDQPIMLQLIKTPPTTLKIYGQKRTEQFKKHTMHSRMDLLWILNKQELPEVQKRKKTGSHKKIPSTYCGFHARKGCIFTYAEKECKVSENSLGSNYRASYTPKYKQSTQASQPRNFNQLSRRSNSTPEAHHYKLSNISSPDTTNYGPPPDLTTTTQQRLQ